MKIENLKVAFFEQNDTKVRVWVYADSIDQVEKSLSGKDSISIYTDNTGKDEFVRDLGNFTYVDVIHPVTPYEGIYDVILVNKPNCVNDAIALAMKRIKRYDESDDINCFYLNGEVQWLDKYQRADLSDSLDCLKDTGEKMFSLWLKGVKYYIPITPAAQMIANLKIYAMQCYNRTQEHRMAVQQMTNIEDILSYDYKTGYPEVLRFDIH